MKRICLFVILFCLLFQLIGCTSEVSPSFKEIAQDSTYVKTVFATSESFVVGVDTRTLSSVFNAVVYTSEKGEIVLSKAEFINPCTIEFHFDARGTLTSNSAALITACIYDSTFLQSSVSITPSNSAYIIYSLQTAEFEEFGNKFSISVHFPDATLIPHELQLTFSNLLFVEFKSEL